MTQRFYADRREAFELVFGQPVAVGRIGGEFSVVSGSVWLTRAGDVEDHLLTAGHALCLAADEAVLVEPLYRDRTSIVAWRPARAALPKAWREARLAGLQVLGGFAWRAARFAYSVANGLNAFARRATAATARC